MDSMTLRWRKSSRSNINGGECVEVARTTAGILTRDSKHPHGPMLRLTPQAWRAFVADVKSSTL